MSEPDARRGAAAVSGVAEPVIDLVRLTALAVRLLSPPKGAPGHLFDYDRHRNSLTIDPSPALRRLIQDPAFKTLSSPKAGLLQFPDESSVPAAAGIVVGARIADGSEDDLAARVKALVQAVD
nr:hypothetical protein [Pseudomonadota bacterium]